MKNKELHEFVYGLNSAKADVPLFEQRLRRTVLKYAPKKQSFFARVFSGLTRTGYGDVRKKRNIVSVGSVALVLLLTFSMLTYTYKFSSKAAAEQLINQSLDSLQTAPAVQLQALQVQFGGDPAAELKEAKQAKDVTVISKAEFETLSKNSAGVFSTSLSSDPTAPQTTSVSVSGGPGGKGAVAYGTATLSSSAVSGTPASGTMPSTVATKSGTVVTGTGTVSISANEGGVVSSGPVTTGASSSTSSSGPASTPGSPPNVTFSTIGGAATNGTTNVDYSSDTPVSANATTTTGPVPMMAQMGADGKTMVIPDQAVIKALNDFKVVEPSKYLRYTDSHGRTVVLSLDAKGLPIFKTIFMNGNEAQALHP